jgi:hypothetical protein
MNYDEQYWRALAIEAQEQAAVEYHLSRHYGGHIGRSFQGAAYETHLKAMARLGLAEKERTISPAQIDALAARYPLNHQFGKIADELPRAMLDPQEFLTAFDAVLRSRRKS